MPRHRPAGYALVELLIVLVVLGILTALAAPDLSAWMRQLRTRSALDRLAADVYRARSLAASRSIRVSLRFLPARGCAHSYLLVRADDETRLDSVSLARRSPGVCLRSNAATPMVIDSRGMLVGSPRMLRAESGGAADSASVSIAGRVYRWY